MSDALFKQVDRLFALLDLDSNGTLDRAEARLGFLACFDRVHRDAADLSAAEKVAVVDKQVHWLFAATSHDDDDTTHGVSIDEFRTCYSNLLKGAYEEEVLLLDLQRAIAGLEAAEQWSLAKRVLDLTNQIWAAIGTGAGAQGQSVSLSDARASAVLHRAFAHITGRSQVLGPKRQTQARKIVAPMLGEAVPPPPLFGVAAEHASAAAASSSAAAAPASAASASASAVSVSQSQLLRVVKDLLALPIPGESIAEDMDAALSLATGGAAASSSSSSAAAAAAPAQMES